jgi:hypothetical protein
MKYKDATFYVIPENSLFDKFLEFRKFGGYITSFGQVYVRAKYQRNAMLLAHEYGHVLQQRTEGRFIWSAKYYAYSLRYGYWSNPYEIDARKFAGDLREESIHNRSGYRIISTALTLIAGLLILM